MAQDPWPSLSDVGDGSVDLEFRKALWQAKLDNIKADLQAQRDQAKADHQADLDAAKAQVATDDERTKNDYASYYTKIQATYQSYLATANASIERTQNRAMYITTAATAISTLYTGLLGFRFVKDVTDKAAPTFPLRGITPLIFFGGAIALTTVYLSFLSKQTQTTPVGTSANLMVDADKELNGYLLWVKNIVEPRLAFLRAAVVSLTCGVFTLPVAFISFGKVWIAIPIFIVAAILVIAAIGTGRLGNQEPPQ